MTEQRIHKRDIPLCKQIYPESKQKGEKMQGASAAHPQMNELSVLSPGVGVKGYFESIP